MRQQARTIAQPKLSVHRGPAWQVTPRDIDILQWVGRHGLVTPDQLGRRFFLREDGKVGQRAAYDRIRKLVELGVLQRLPTFYREPHVLRVTRLGADLANNDVGSANLVLSDVRHAIALVDLTEQLLKTNKGSTLETEREFRARRLRAIREDKHRLGKGRIPDAVLTLASGEYVAIELDLTPKRRIDIERILRSFMFERVKRVWWYCASKETVERVREIVRRRKADDFVEVRLWSPH